MVRRRSPRVHERVLEAALALFAERGMVGTSMDAIAEASSVSKATIYNHWADKDALCLEALGRLYGLDETPPNFDSGSLREDLVAMLRYRPAAHREALQQQIMPHLMVYASQNRTFGDAWRKQVLTLPRARLGRRLKIAVEAGELDADLHIEFAVAMLIGTMVFRDVFKNAHGGLPADTPERLADAFCRAFQTIPRARTRRRSATLARRTPRTRA
jgi:AcrR family transcriptional regulator